MKTRKSKLEKDKQPKKQRRGLEPELTNTLDKKLDFLLKQMQQSFPKQEQNPERLRQDLKKELGAICTEVHEVKDKVLKLEDVSNKLGSKVKNSSDKNYGTRHARKFYLI